MGSREIEAWWTVMYHTIYPNLLTRYSRRRTDNFTLLKKNTPTSKQHSIRDRLLVGCLALGSTWIHIKEKEIGKGGGHTNRRKEKGLTGLVDMWALQVYFIFYLLSSQFTPCKLTCINYIWLVKITKQGFHTQGAPLYWLWYLAIRGEKKRYAIYMHKRKRDTNSNCEAA